MIAVARPVAPAACTPREAPRMTIAVLMYSSGRTASFNAAATAGNRLPTTRPTTSATKEARLAGHTERPSQTEIFTLVRRGRDVAVVASQPAKVAEPKNRAEAQREPREVQ